MWTSRASLSSPAAAGTSAGTGTAGTEPAGGGAEAAAAGCNKAAGPAGSNRSHLVVRTAAASVKKSGKESEKVKKYTSGKSNMVSMWQHEVGCPLGSGIRCV